MSFDIKFYNMPELTLVTPQQRLFYYDLLDVSINGVRRQFLNGTTDLGTIPDLLENVVQNDDPHFLRSFILHDELCKAEGGIEPFPHFNSLEAAAILRAGGLVDGSPEWKADAVFIAVALKGPHWK